MRDLHNNIKPARALSPASVADNTAQVGEWVDRAGFESLEFLIAVAAIADVDATFAVLIEDADEDDFSDAAAVADDFLLGTEAAAAFTFDDDHATRKIGYVGSKRYARITITPAANATATLLTAIAVLGNPRHAPTA